MDEDVKEEKLKIELIKSNDTLIKNAVDLIKLFWKEHNNIEQNDYDARLDYNDWTKEGHILYLVKYMDDLIGFAHLGNRGASIDWLEDLFILPEFQNKGIGRTVISNLEVVVEEYSESLYIEVAARNLKALKLYRNLGYDCLNTITIRKDFNVDNFDVISKEKISDYNFEIRKYKKIDK